MAREDTFANSLSIAFFHIFVDRASPSLANQSYY